MDTKLTLNIDKNVIEKAKIYAKSHKVSLSQITEFYLSSLVSESKSKEEITPLVQKLTGVIKIDNDSELKNDYTDFLIEKYK